MTGRAGPSAARRTSAWVVGGLGLLTYNWWLAVAVGLIGGRHLLPSVDALYSDLETLGRPYSAELRTLDLVAGGLLLVALLLRGPAGPDGPRREWRWLVVFAVAAIVGGLFPYVCEEGVSAACRSAEWHLRLPARHYIHVLSGIVEFLAASWAALIAWRRTSGLPGAVRGWVRTAGTALVVAYPLIGLSYLTERLGALVEPAFFLAFSVLVAVELAEPASLTGGRTVP